MQMNNSVIGMVSETGHRAPVPSPGTSTYSATQNHPEPKSLSLLKVLVQRHD